MILMKKHLLFLLTTILSFNCYSQITFEKGYFINNNGEKTDCLIKNIDWVNNPTEFEFKLSEIDEAKKSTISTIKEFGIVNVLKFIRAKVKIDRSSLDINKLSNDRNPVFNEEQLFLKVLVEGKVTLYQYTDKSLKRYFYRVDNESIEQLVYKNYMTVDNRVGENKYYQQQLWKNLECDNLSKDKIKNISYTKNDLIKFFKDYSECQESPLVYIEPNQKKDLFNLTIRPRINYSSLEVQNDVIFPGHTIEFENKIGVGLGVEAEFILPFNKNKWAIVIEPTYQSFNSEGEIDNVSSIFGGTLSAKIEYSSIEVPLGCRHYFYLNNSSKIFINASIVFDINLKTSFTGTLSNGSDAFAPQENATSTANLAFGIGYKFYDKFSLEMRYQTGRQIIGANEMSNWGSDYRTSSIIFGYSLF